MWFNFSVAFFLYIAVLYIPSYYFLSALQVDQRISLSLAPAATALCYVLSGIVLYWLGISSTPQTVILPWTLLFLFAGVFTRIKNQQGLAYGLIFKGIYIPFCYVLVGVVVTTVVFVASLDGAGAFFQDGTDNFLHLNAVRSLAQSGDMSCLSISIYEHSASAVTSANFYPAEWHILAALCMQTLSVEPTICINALNTALIAVVFPLGLYSFLVAIDSDNRTLHIAGSVTSLAVCSCPWEFLLWGPLYANLLGLVFVFGISSCFITLLHSDSSKAFIPITYFIIGCLAIAFAQPNCIMTMGVILAPFLVYHSYKFFNEKKLPAVPLACAVTFAIVIFWIVCRNSPIFLKVATFNWAPILDAKSAARNILRLTLIYNPAQWLVAFCVLLGILRVFYLHRNRWLCFSPFFFAVAYIVDISSNGLLRTYLSGFWYNDFYRIACMYGLCLVPLVTYGLESLACLAEYTYTNKLNGNNAASVTVLIQAIPIVVFCLICYRQGSFIQLPYAGYSCFDFISTTVKYQYTLKSPTASLTEGGADFLEKVRTITGTKDLVINDPHDGSVYAYGIKNINTYYRNFFFPKDNEVSDLIRTRLANISFDNKVKEAVKSVDAKYVLVLDNSFDGKSGINYFNWYKREEWKGIHNITEDTPGFELVLIEGNMRLYRITGQK